MEVYEGMELKFKIPGHTCEGKIEKFWFRESLYHRNKEKERWLIIKGKREDGHGCGLLIQDNNLKEYIVKQDTSCTLVSNVKFEQLKLF